MKNVQWQGHRIMAGKVDRSHQHYKVNFLYLQIKIMTIEIRTVNTNDNNTNYSQTLNMCQMPHKDYLI